MNTTSSTSSVATSVTATAPITNTNKSNHHDTKSSNTSSYSTSSTSSSSSSSSSSTKSSSQTKQPQQQQQMRTSWSAIAAIGTSSEGKTTPPTMESITMHSTVDAGLDSKVEELGKQQGQQSKKVGNVSSGKKLRSTKIDPSKGSTSSNDNGISDANSSTSTKSVSVESGNSSANQNNKNPIPAPAPPVKKNPWKILPVNDIYANTTSDKSSDDAPTPAESKDMRAPTRKLSSSNLIGGDGSVTTAASGDVNTKGTTSSGDKEFRKDQPKKANGDKPRSKNKSATPKESQQGHEIGQTKQSYAKRSKGTVGSTSNVTAVSAAGGDKSTSDMSEVDKNQSPTDTETISNTSSSSSSQDKSPRVDSESNNAAASTTNTTQQGQLHNKKAHNNANQRSNKKGGNNNLNRNKNKHANGNTNNNNSNNNGKSKSHKKQHEKRNKSGKNNKNKRNQDKLHQYSYVGKLPLTQDQINKLKPRAVAQVEYFFSNTELAKNVFLRKHMDIEGYVPFAFIYNFPSVASFYIPYKDLLDSVNELSRKVEVDMVNECIRIKSHSDSEEEPRYKKWLFPNADGTLGCHKWIKEAVAEETSEATATDGEKNAKQSSNNNGNELGIEVVETVKSEDKSLDITLNTDSDEKHCANFKDKTDCGANRACPDLTMTDSDTEGSQ